MRGILSCSATICVNNMSGICSASTINISGVSAHKSEETQCETFDEKGLKNSLTNVLNMNVVGEIKQVFDNDSIEMSPRIRCKAINCKHNEEKLCTAKNILVNGIDVSSNEKKSINIEKTQCETFEEE
ncbi:MAG TPA: DUF1540 domain-containing protein [Clostridium sp.]|uniref:DUF1540 domain-containing protein n=1 Tax=Clostridium sp. TaxID=1506 RepID=UPI002F9471B5